MCSELRRASKIRRAHLDSEGFNLWRARDDAPIVEREHRDWPVPEVRTKYALTRGIKMVTVNERKHERDRIEDRSGGYGR